MRFDLVIFDCDGVLIDSELLSVRADREALAECGIELSIDEILERYTGISFAATVADLEARHGRLPADFADRRRRRLWPLFDSELQAIPGVSAVIDALTCKACVASSGRPDRLRHALSLVGFYDRFHPGRGCPRQAGARPVPPCGRADGSPAGALRRDRGQPA